jgi:IclR family mhp operon transcriptional activator
MERGVPIRSVSRSLAVLQVINFAGSMSLMEIAKAVKLPYATTARLVLTLIHEGMIEQEPSRKNYRPTVLVQSLASGYVDHSHIGAVARPHIVDLTKKHGWPVAVSTRFGMNMIVRECTHTISPYTLSTYYPGFVYPLLESAAGLVYLAFSSQRDRELSRDDLAMPSAWPPKPPLRIFEPRDSPRAGAIASRFPRERIQALRRPFSTMGNCAARSL